MLYLPVEHLKPGMIIAYDITSDVSCLSLLTENQTLTAAKIKKLIDGNIPGVYVKSDFCEEIVAQPLIPPQVRRKTIDNLKKIFTSYTKQSLMTSLNYKDIRNTAEKLLMYSLSKDECLLNVIEIKQYDDYTYTHSMYVGVLSAIIGMKIGLTKAQQIDLCTCGLLHDAGKMDIPIEIVNKPDQLCDEEFEEMKKHPDNAVERLRGNSCFSSVILNGIRTHHEWMDGTGYPLGLKGKEIPLFGRILALADVYDALTSCRSYRKAWTSSEAIEYIMSGAQTHFDHDVLQAFLKSVVAYPVGCIVKLSNGDIAIVVKNYPDNILRPKVKVFSGVSELGQEIDLNNDFNYLNITVEGTIKKEDKLPGGLFK